MARNRSPQQRGIRILGAPLGTQEFINGFGEGHVAKASTLLQRILELPQLQHAWLLLYFCLVPRLNHLLRQVPPRLLQETTHGFDQLIEGGLRELLQAPGPLPQACLRQARLPLREGGLGLRDNSAIAPAAYWSSWADVLPELQSRYPAVAAHVRKCHDQSVDHRLKISNDHN